MRKTTTGVSGKNIGTTMTDKSRDYVTEYLAKPDDFGCVNCDCKDGVCLELRACAQVGAPGLLALLKREIGEV